MDIVTYSDARANLKGVMDQVVKDRSLVVVARQKAGSVVMIALEEWNAIAETMHLLSSRTNAERLRGAIEQLDAGGGSNHELGDA